jgi:hypothetical protein
VVTNPIFLEDEPSFLAKEKIDDFADEPAFKYAYERDTALFMSNYLIYRLGVGLNLFNQLQSMT